MNIRLDIAIRDMVGKSGLNIIEAILAGQRDPEYLASLVDIRVKKTHQEIADSLKGWWREELLYDLRSSLDFYKFYKNALAKCDKAIERQLTTCVPKASLSQSDVKVLKANIKKRPKNAPVFDVSRIAYQYFHTNLFAISGISHTTVLCLISNMGRDLCKFPTAKSFAS